MADIHEEVEGHCHGLAWEHAPSLDSPAAPPLPTVEIGDRDLTLKARSVQDLEALADVALLWDNWDRATVEESRGETQG